MSKKVINVQMDKEYYESVIGNVPQSGGGSASSWRYFDVTAMPDTQELVTIFDFCQYVKVKVNNTIATKQTASFINGLPSSLTLLCVAVDFAQLVTITEENSSHGHIGTVKDVWDNLGLSVNDFLSMGAVEITEEQFYTL